jgi:hypothetical protein
MASDRSEEQAETAQESQHLPLKRSLAQDFVQGATVGGGLAAGKLAVDAAAAKLKDVFTQPEKPTIELPPGTKE